VYCYLVGLAAAAAEDRLIGLTQMVNTTARKFKRKNGETPGQFSRSFPKKSGSMFEEADEHWDLGIV
jgi:hypothetical protein